MTLQHQPPYHASGRGDLQALTYGLPATATDAGATGTDVIVPAAACLPPVAAYHRLLPLGVLTSPGQAVFRQGVNADTRPHPHKMQQQPPQLPLELRQLFLRPSPLAPSLWDSRNRSMEYRQLLSPVNDWCERYRPADFQALKEGLARSGSMQQFCASRNEPLCFDGAGHAGAPQFRLALQPADGRTGHSVTQLKTGYAYGAVYGSSSQGCLGRSLQGRPPYLEPPLLEPRFGCSLPGLEWNSLAAVNSAPFLTPNSSRPTVLKQDYAKLTRFHPYLMKRPCILSRNEQSQGSDRREKKLLGLEPAMENSAVSRTIAEQRIAGLRPEEKLCERPITLSHEKSSYSKAAVEATPDTSGGPSSATLCLLTTGAANIIRSRLKMNSRRARKVLNRRHLASFQCSKSDKFSSGLLSKRDPANKVKAKSKENGWRTGREVEREVEREVDREAARKRSDDDTEDDTEHGSDENLGDDEENKSSKVYGCTQCPYGTDRKNNLKRHVLTMHQRPTRLLECCGTVFHSKAALRDHVALCHRGGYRCQVCNRNFCRKALLRRHLAVHSGQKDFACRLCGYATSHKSNLERHQRVHLKKASPVAGQAVARHSGHGQSEDQGAAHGQGHGTGAGPVLRDEARQVRNRRKASHDRKDPEGRELVLWTAGQDEAGDRVLSRTMRKEVEQQNQSLQSEADFPRCSPDVDQGGVSRQDIQISSTFSDVHRPLDKTTVCGGDHGTGFQSQCQLIPKHSSPVEQPEINQTKHDCSQYHQTEPRGSPLNVPAGVEISMVDETQVGIVVKRMLLQQRGQQRHPGASLSGKTRPENPGSFPTHIIMAEPCGKVHLDHLVQDSKHGGKDLPGDSGLTAQISDSHQREIISTRRLRFPNRLKETYSTDDLNRRPGAPAPNQSGCHRIAERVNKIEAAGSSEYRPTQTTESPEEGRVGTPKKIMEAAEARHSIWTSMNTHCAESVDLKKMSFSLSRTAGQGSGPDRSLKGKQLQSKQRICCLPYKCSGCDASFARQEELRGHTCRVKDLDIFHFPLISSMFKGCIRFDSSISYHSD